MIQRLFLSLPAVPLCLTLPLTAQDDIVLSARALENRHSVVHDDRTVEVTAHPVGVSGLPPHSVELQAETAATHTPDNALQVRITSEKPVLVWMTAYSEPTAGEVYPVRKTSGGDKPEYVRWTFDSRIGSAGDPSVFRIGIGTKEGIQTVVVDDYAIEPTVNLTDEDVIAASTWATLSISHAEPRDPSRSLEVFTAIPRVVARRCLGSRIVVDVNGEKISESLVEEEDSGSRALWQSEIRVPLGNYAEGGPHTVSAKLIHPDDSEVSLGSRHFRLLHEKRSFQQWEYPHQSIEDYEVFSDGPDFRVIAILRDLYACDEPDTSKTMQREIHDTRITTDVTLWQDEVAWRAPAYGLWLSGGFHSMALGDYDGALSAYVTGMDPDGLEVLGHLSTVAYSEMRPSVKNPTWGPAEIFTGWKHGMRRTIRPITITTYGRGFLLLSGVQIENENPVVVGALSNELLYWTDAGVVPLDLPVAARHMDVDHRDGFHYLYTDDPDRIFVSRDPLRNWEPRSVSLPQDWFRFRVILFEGTEYLFGLHTIDGKNVLRWREIEWKDESGNVSLPHLKEPDAT